MKKFLLALIVFSFLPAFAGSFYVGESVVFTQTDGTHYNARILEIFSDGKIRINFPNQEYADSDVSLSSLSVPLRYKNGFGVGDAVVFKQTDGTHYNAQILELFEDGKAKIHFPNGEYADSDVSLSMISKALPFVYKFRVGDNVIFTQTDGTHYNARVLEIFNDGMMKITFPGGEYSDSDVNMTMVSKPLSSQGRFSVNENVIFTQTDGTHYHAQIVQIFEDGKIRISFPNGEYAVSDVGSNSLSKLLYYYGEFKVGDDVVFTQTDGSHYNAKLVEIFEDGKARISFPNGEYAVSDVSFGSLSKSLPSIRR